MDRLTFKHDLMGWQLRANITVRGNCLAYNTAMEHLAAYEDTGMTPEEIEKLADSLIRSRKFGDDLAHMMAEAIRTREKVKDKLRKQSRHTLRARKQRDALKAEVAALRDEMAALKADKPVAGNPHNGNRVLSLQEVLSLPEGARVYLEYNEPSRGCPAKKETAYGKVFICAEDAAMHGIYGLNAEYLLGGDKPLARVWSLPVAPTDEERAAEKWEVEG